MKTHIRNRLVAVLALAVSTGAASATLIEIDTTNTVNFAELGNTGNVTISLSVEPGMQIVGIGLDANLTTFGDSLISDVGIRVSDANNLGSSALLEGLGDNAPGQNVNISTNGIIPLSFLGFDPIVLDSGTVFIEFYDSFDNVANGADSIWNGGTLTLDIQPVPAPGAIALLMVTGGIAGSRRRRV